MVMNTQFLISCFSGNWITQNTVYCVKKEYISISKNIVNWSVIHNKRNCLAHIIDKVKKKYSRAHLAKVNHKDIGSVKHCLFLFDNTKPKGIILVLSHDFQILHSTSFRHNSCDFIYMIYKNADIEIKERIYFVNSNLKLVKSTIEKHQKCIGISFSSEIKIK